MEKENKISEKDEWLVPLYLAEKLKEIGFDKPTMFFYDKRKSFIDDKGYFHYETIFDNYKGWRPRNHNEVEGIYSAPTYEQAFDWFREKKFIALPQLEINTEKKENDELTYFYYNVYIPNGEIEKINGGEKYINYKEMRIDMLENLIHLYIKCNKTEIKENKEEFLNEYEAKLKYKINRFRNCVIRFYKENKEEFSKELIIFNSEKMKPIIKILENTYKKENYKKDNFTLYEEPYTSLKKVFYKIENLADSKLLKNIQRSINYYDKELENVKDVSETHKNINLEDYNSFVISFPNWWFEGNLSFDWQYRMKQYADWNFAFDPRPNKRTS